MLKGLSFRAGIALIVGGYALIAAVLAFGAGRELWEPVGHYFPQVSWLMPDTTSVRVAALKAAGLPGDAALYALIAAVSWALIAALTAGGFAWGVMTTGETLLGVDKAVNYATALAGLYAVGKLTELALHAVQKGMPEGGLHSMPGLWFATMIPSAAILARLGALAAHDAGALLTVAFEGDPGRLAALVRSSEERRGAESLEAKLARRIARLRAPA
jgi:hypothetical protein